MSGGRKLTREDQALWNKVLQSVTPRHPHLPAAGPEPDVPETKASRGTRMAAPKTAPPAKPAKPVASAAPYFPPVSGSEAGSKPALSALEPRQKKRLARGRAEIDGRLDLHGMRQSTAFHTLIGFLRRAQAQNMSTVLVITGKGSSPQSEGHDGERGVLRRAVPQWLSRGEFRDLVIGFEPASRRHGGDGALYVRIRRSRQG